MSYTTRRGSGKSCPECGSIEIELDHNYGEYTCRACGFVIEVEAILSVEKGEDGELQTRQADLSLGSLVDKKSHPLERKHQWYDSKPKISHSKFESEMRDLIGIIFDGKSKSKMIKNLDQILVIKRKYSQYISDQNLMQTNSLKKGDQILFLRPGGRSSGNQLCALILTHHYGKMLDNWNANISVSEKDVDDLLNKLETHPEGFMLIYNADIRRTVRKDLKGLKLAWKSLRTMQEYTTIVPPIPKAVIEDSREIILQIHRELFQTQNNEFDSMIYGIDSSLFNQFKIPQVRSSLIAFVWEVERHRAGIKKSEMKEIRPLEKYPTKTISNDALFVYEQLTK